MISPLFVTALCASVLVGESLAEVKRRGLGSQHAGVGVIHSGRVNAACERGSWTCNRAY
jgi:hypothetical protein